MWDGVVPKPSVRVAARPLRQRPTCAKRRGDVARSTLRARPSAAKEVRGRGHRPHAPVDDGGALAVSDDSPSVSGASESPSYTRSQASRCQLHVAGR